MNHAEKEKDILEIISNLSKTAEENQRENQRHSLTRKDYGTGAQIVRALGISKLRLMTKNPNRKIGLSGYGLEVVETVTL